MAHCQIPYLRVPKVRVKFIFYWLMSWDSGHSSLICSINLKCFSAKYTLISFSSRKKRLNNQSKFNILSKNGPVYIFLMMFKMMSVCVCVLTCVHLHIRKWMRVLKRISWSESESHALIAECRGCYFWVWTCWGIDREFLPHRNIPNTNPRLDRRSVRQTG